MGRSGWRTGDDRSPDAIRDRVRVGTDLVRVEDVAAAVERFGDRYLTRVYTEHEIDICRGHRAIMAARLASRFAAKEATVKVLRPRTHNPDWRSIEVRRHPNGWCDLHLDGFAAELARDTGITDVAVSISHEGASAMAFVVALCGQPLE